MDLEEEEEGIEATTPRLEMGTNNTKMDDIIDIQKKQK